MFTFINSRILLSGAIILAAAAAIIGATFAFFSDTETSSANSFVAGAIDLHIDNESYVTDQRGILVASPNNTWAEADLSDQLFFSFSDVKPGDIGEDTISVHVDNNDSWVCMAADTTATPDNGIVEPEADAGDITDGQQGGELQNYLNFSFWKDDGDNVYEVGEELLPSLTGSMSSLFDGTWHALADSTTGLPLSGGVTSYVGKAWCFGTLTPNPVAQDGQGKIGTNGPLDRGTGFTCSGLGNQNDAQTDGIVVDVAFQAVQSRNNAQFTCGSLEPFEGTSNLTVTKVNANNIANDLGEVAQDLSKWFFYNDESEQIDSSLGSFVAGPGTPPNPNGSAQMTVSGTQRKNIATYQFKDVKISDIDAMSFGTYSQSAGNGSPNSGRAPYLHFNVDFDNSDTWQKRLVYVPSANGTVIDDTWQTWNTTGNSLWTWSGYAANGNKWPDGNPNANRTWNDIVAAFPNAETRSTDSWLGIRVGEPYADGFTGNVDFFSITINGATQKFNFDN